jgi:hypothetical protein
MSGNVVGLRIRASDEFTAQKDHPAKMDIDPAVGLSPSRGALEDVEKKLQWLSS